MQPQKRIFFLLAALFTLVMIGFSIDFMSRTTRPGQKPQLEQRIKKKYLSPDSLRRDSLRR